MKCPVYKSLDKPSSFLGLRGSYLRIAIIGIFVAAVLTWALVGRNTNGLIGFIAFVVMAAAVYLGIIGFQSKFSERERDKWIASRRLPDVLKVHPRPFREYTKKKR